MKEAPVANNIWFPFYMGDYLAKTSHLSQTEHGAYLCFMLYYYSNKRPISHNRRYSICRAFAEHEQVACDSVLAEYFTRDGDVWRNKRADDELLKSQDISEKRAKAAHSRYKQMQSKCNANAVQMHTQSQSQVLEDKSSNNPLPPKGAVLPDWLDQEIWKDFCQHRTKLKAPMTERAKQMMIGELRQLQANGHDPTAVLSQSITRGWKGIFELKGNYNDNTRTSAAKPTVTDSVNAMLGKIERGEF